MLAQTVGIDDLIDVSEVTALDVGIAIILLIVGFVLGRVIRNAVLNKMPFIDDVPDRMAIIVARGAGYTVTFIFAVYALSFLGVDTGPIFILILFVLVVAFFSLKPLLENFAAGLLLQTRSPFDSGDVITVAGITGTLTDIDARTTVIVTPAGDEVRIPNTQVLGGTIVNHSAGGARRSSLSVGVAYGTDVTHARVVIEGALTALDPVLPEPPARAGLASFDDSAIVYEVRYWHGPGDDDEYEARDSVVEAIDRAFKANDIAIPFPQRDVWMRDPSPTRTPQPDANDQVGDHE
jgi:small conductance mechanosensitive channel